MKPIRTLGLLFFMVGLALMLTTLVYMLYYVYHLEELSDKQETKCYDGYGHEIVGEFCLKGSQKKEFLGNFLYISMVILFVGEVFMILGDRE